MPFARNHNGVYKGLLHNPLRAIRARCHYYIHFDIDSPGRSSQPIIRLRAMYANESRNHVTALRGDVLKPREPNEPQVYRFTCVTLRSMNIKEKITLQIRQKAYICAAYAQDTSPRNCFA